MNKHFPKVLFLTPCAFNKVTGGGITFTNLFDGWPRDRLATIHNDSIPTTSEVCNLYYRLTDCELVTFSILQRYKPKCQNGNAPFQPKKDFDNLIGIFYKALIGLKFLIFGDGLPAKGHLTASLEAWIKEYQPQVLYTIMGSIAFMELAKEISSKFNLPIVIHFMDDWPVAIYRGGIISFLQRHKMNYLLRELTRKSSVRLAISEAMAVEYTRRYGLNFGSIQNAIDLSKWSGYSRKIVRNIRHVRLAYIGSILPFAQLQSLVDCCRAVQSICDEGRSISLEIYTPLFLAGKFIKELQAGDSIILRDALTDDGEMFKILQEVDIVLLPVNFDQSSIRFIKYSMPTKIPSYLSACAPILAYGPSEVAQISYALDAGWAYVVPVRDAKALKSGILKIINDYSLRKSLSKKAHKCAIKNHNLVNVKAVFHNYLINSVN